ncbi:T9SS type A sorting domain-containing protein [Anaerophaga thermohalophila]|uniref:T9SS type A sorting domain-containing protein n=1 Tax=Anaerophaga thermohalophila TaxID=177400 RepID=UPI0009E27DE8
MDQCSDYEQDKSNIEIYPNPAKNRIFILGDAIITCNIYDMKSTLMKSISNPSGKIDISDLPSGLYIFKIKTDQGIISKKVTKQ